MPETVEIKPACINLAVVRGTDNTWEFVLLDNDAKALNMGDDDVVFTIRDEFEGNIQVQATSSAGSHFEGNSGKVEFTLPRAAIDDEANARVRTFWVYEIRRIDLNNNQHHVHIAGDFVICPTPVN